MAPIDILEIHALLKLMENSEAIKAMDPLVVFALVLQLQNPTWKLIEKLNSVLIKEQEGYKNIKNKAQNQVNNIIENYKHNLGKIKQQSRIKNQGEVQNEQELAENILNTLT